MLGTAADVSRYAGHYEHVFESTTAGVTIQAPQLDINTVAAGGGSRLFFRAGVFQARGHKLGLDSNDSNGMGRDLFQWVSCDQVSYWLCNGSRCYDAGWAGVSRCAPRPGVLP
jgi:hypothetical protein